MTLKFSIPQTLLALAIAYFAYALMGFSKEVPSFIKAVDRTTPHITTIVDEVALVRSEIALVRSEVTLVRGLVDKQVPAILLKIDTALPLVEQGLAQSEQYSKQLPILWQHLDKIEVQMQALQEDLPKVLKRVDDAVITSNEAINELAQWRPVSEEYLTQIEHSRDDIPQYLTRIEGIVIDSKNIGEEASSGLVPGFFKGIISLPFEVLTGLAGIVDSKSRSAKNLTANDITIIQEKVVILLENNTSKQISWQNKKSGNRGKITKETEFKKKGQTCHRIILNNNFKGQQETLRKVACKNKDDLWQVL